MNVAHRGLWLVTVVLLGLPACFTSTPSEIPSSRLQEIRDLLQKRARSLEAGDQQGYLDAVEADARVEKTIARGAEAAQVSDINLNIAEAVDPNAPAYEDVAVRFSFHYEPLPEDNEFDFELRYDISKRGRSWVITRSVPGSPLPLWASGPVQAERSEHFLAVFRPGAPGVEHYLASAEQARANLIPKLTLDPDPVALLQLARTEAEYQAVTGGRGASSLASTSFTQGARGGIALARQMMVDLSATGRASVASEDDVGLPARIVLQHELAHLMLSRYTLHTTPGWVVEGAAMYLSGEDRSSEWRAGAQSGLWDRVSITHEQMRDGCALYAFCNAAALYLIDKYGPDKFFRLYHNYRYHTEDPAATSILLDKIYGISEQQVDTGARRYIADAISAGR